MTAGPKARSIPGGAIKPQLTAQCTDHATKPEAGTQIEGDNLSLGVCVGLWDLIVFRQEIDKDKKGVGTPLVDIVRN